MKFGFTNLGSAEKTTLGVPYVVISITTPGLKQAEFVEDPNRKDILRMAFHDVDKPTTGSILYNKKELRFDLTLFSLAMAKEIAAFVKKHEGQVDYVLCHCEGGVSRSPAIVAAFEKMHRGTDEWVFKSSNPNRLVYRKMLATLLPKTS